MNRCAKKDITLLIYYFGGKGELFCSEHLGNNRYKLFEAIEPFQVGDIVFCDYVLEADGLIKRPKLDAQQQQELQLEIRDLWRLLGKSARNR